MSQKGPSFEFFDILQQCMLLNPKGSPFCFFRHCDIFERKNLFFPVGEKWFQSLIKHERHPLGVSKLFSELFINKSWACFENFALFKP